MKVAASPISPHLDKTYPPDIEYIKAAGLLMDAIKQAERGDFDGAKKTANKITIFILQESAFNKIARTATLFGYFDKALATARQVDDSAIRNRALCFISEIAAERGNIHWFAQAIEPIDNAKLKSNAAKDIQNRSPRYLRRHSL